MTDQKKEWWQQGYGFKVQSGTTINGKEVGYGMITDEHTGYTYYKDGDKWDISLKTSMEICGRKVNEKEPAKIIYARNGDIHFEAVNGQITLKAKSIRLVAEDGDGQQNGRECEQKLSKGEDCNVTTSLEYYNKTYK